MQRIGHVLDCSSRYLTISLCVLTSNEIFILFLKIKLAEGNNPTGNDPKMIALSIFNLFGVDEGSKLSKQQFIDGYA